MADTTAALPDTKRRKIGDDDGDHEVADTNAKDGDGDGDGASSSLPSGPKRPSNREALCGIRCFLSTGPHRQSLAALIKHRYTDFMVSEIGLDGEVCVIDNTSTAPPPPDSTSTTTATSTEAVIDTASSSATVAEGTQPQQPAASSAADAPATATNDTNTSSTNIDVSVAGRQILSEMGLDDEVINKLDALNQRQQQPTSTLTPDEGEKEKDKDKEEEKDEMLVQAPADSTKAWRTQFHATIRSHFPNLRSETVIVKHVANSNNTVRVFMAPRNGSGGSGGRVDRRGGGGRSGGDGQQQQKQQRQERWPQSRPSYVECVLYKENKDTTDALGVLSKMLRVRPNSWGFAGTKDKRGVTMQRVTLYKVDPQRIVQLNARLFGIRLGNIRYRAKGLQLGELQGNRFFVVLRDLHLKAVTPSSFSSSSPSASFQAVVESACAAVADRGFINYYGLQRFGTGSVPTHHVGRACLQRNWEKAVHLILDPREGETPDAEQARQYYHDNPHAPIEDHLSRFPKKLYIERMVLQGLARAGSKGYLNAIQSLPRPMRLMYVHAYQSYIWNSAVSRRIELYGTTGPVPGDLVLISSAASLPSSSVTEQQENPEGDSLATDGTLDEVGGGDADEFSNSNSASNAQVKVLQSIEEIEREGWTIYDVILPLPGGDIKYPQHQVLQHYTDLLAQDGLSLNDWTHSVKEFNLAGAYRKLMSKPANFSSQLFGYESKDGDMVSHDANSIYQASSFSPSQDLTLPFVGLRLEFDLPSSSYATMLFRELLYDSEVTHFTV